MTEHASRTRVRPDDSGGLSAECSDCGVQLTLVRGAHIATALTSLDAAHPARAHARRAHVTPVGWHAALSGLGTSKQ